MYKPPEWCKIEASHMARRGHVVRDKAETAAPTEKNGPTATLTGGRSSLAHIVVGQRWSDVPR